MTVRAAALLALLLPAVAAAQYDPSRPPPPPPPGPPPGAPPSDRGPGPTGLTLGARLGWGTPGGDISDEGDPPLDDLVDSKIPIWLELGYRFNPMVWGGVYLELAPMSVNDAYCLPGRDCDASSVRFGIDVQFHLAPAATLDPWFGIGVGAEFISVDAYDPSVDDLSDFGFGGFELPLLEAGLDLALSPRFTVGPYVSWSLGQYTSYSVDTPGLPELSGGIDDHATHSWFQVGVKGTFKL